MQDNVAVNT